MSNWSTTISDSDTDNVDNPKHTYYLKVCYICKETTTKEHCIHYGALACFSCRAFFRRAHQGMQDKGLTDDGKRKLPEFVCKKSGRCNVTTKTRRRCQKCRYDLCLKAGMQPEAVMTDDQVKVRFRKMFTKRLSETSENQNTAADDNIIHERDLGADTDFAESFEEQEDIPMLLPYYQGSNPTIVEEDDEHRPDMGHNMIRNCNLASSSRSEMSFAEGVKQESIELRALSTDSNPVQEMFDSPSSDIHAEEMRFHNYGDYPSKETAKVPSSDAHTYILGNISNKTLRNADLEAPGKNDHHIPEIRDSLTYSEMTIKSEQTEHIAVEIDPVSYLPKEHDNSSTDSDNIIQAISNENIEDRILPSPRLVYSPDDHIKLQLEDSIHYSHSENAFETANAEKPNRNNVRIVGTNDYSYQIISDKEENREVVNTEERHLQTDANFEPNSLKSNIICEQLHNKTSNWEAKEEQISSPVIFKSPSLPVSKFHTKRRRKQKPKKLTLDLITSVNKYEHISPKQNEKEIFHKRHDRIRKRITELETSYRIACSQIVFPNHLSNTLINFHVGFSSIDKEHFLSCAYSLVSYIQPNITNISPSINYLFIFILSKYYYSPC